MDRTEYKNKRIKEIELPSGLILKMKVPSAMEMLDITMKYRDKPGEELLAAILKKIEECIKQVDGFEDFELKELYEPEDLKALQEWAMSFFEAMTPTVSQVNLKKS
ncbi:MAG: hypothetical protein KA467_00030 [Bacteroidales bacterium]|nr:hypothetical protein [Bacteroidales bacterium]